MILKEEREEYHIEILSNDIEKFNITYKIGLFGDNEVGKTCLLKKVVNNEFCDYYDKTIQYTILYIYLRLNNDIIQLQIWDTAGDFSSISFLLPKLQLAILCYSIENKESFENIEKWLKSVKNLAKSNIKIFLVGNKCDLKNRVITMDEGKIFQQQNSLDYFIENSDINQGIFLLKLQNVYLKKIMKREMKMKLIEELMKVFNVNIIFVIV